MLKNKKLYKIFSQNSKFKEPCLKSRNIDFKQAKKDMILMNGTLHG